MAHLHSSFPLLFPLDADESCLDGYITVRGRELRIRIERPRGKPLSEATLFGDWPLQHCLQGYESLVKARLGLSPDVATFLVELQDILQSTIQSEDVANPVVSEDSTTFTRIMKDIDEIGWQRVVFVDSSFKKIQFSGQDSTGREHSLQVNIPEKYPMESPDCSVDLPEAFVPQWSSKSSLKILLEQFDQFVEKFIDLWHQLDEIDQKTVVIEPENPQKSDIYRRIALGNNSSIQMSLNPSHPRMCPECQFLGADHVINPLREKLNANISSWNKAVSVLTNIQTMLDLKFPEPSDHSKQEFSGECGICYTYRLDTGIPDTVCDNSQCNKPFHRSCLYEWLRSLPTSSNMSKFGFNKAFGECPYCGTQTTVHKPD